MLWRFQLGVHYSGYPFGIHVSQYEFKNSHLLSFRRHERTYFVASPPPNAFLLLELESFVALAPTIVHGGLLILHCPQPLRLFEVTAWTSFYHSDTTWFDAPSPSSTYEIDAFRDTT